MSQLLLHLHNRLPGRVDRFLRTNRLLGPWRIDRAVDAEALVGTGVDRFEMVLPKQDRVALATTQPDHDFLRIAKYFREGFFARPNLFTCEVPEAVCQIGTGLICTPDFRAINDSQMTYRMEAGPVAVGNPIYRPYRWFKPIRTRRVPGLCATIGNVYQSYWGHWLFDCLPRLYSLDRASAGRPVTLLVPDDMAPTWYESLRCVLPANFELLRLPGHSWARADRMLLASYPTARANNYLPREFSNYVRQACFARFGLAAENAPSEKIYVSRAGTRHRRILNEAGLAALLSRYGFMSVALEKITYRDQVELFHRAESVVVTEGSSCANMLFAGPIPILVLYSQQEPNTHWFTAAKSLGQQHFFVTGDGETPHSDFTVDLATVEKVLREQMGLRAEKFT